MLLSELLFFQRIYFWILPHLTIRLLCNFLANKTFCLDGIIATAIFGPSWATQLIFWAHWPTHLPPHEGSTCSLVQLQAWGPVAPRSEDFRVPGFWTELCCDFTDFRDWGLMTLILEPADGQLVILGAFPSISIQLFTDLVLSGKLASVQLDSDLELSRVACVTSSEIKSVWLSSSSSG